MILNYKNKKSVEEIEEFIAKVQKTVVSIRKKEGIGDAVPKNWTFWIKTA